MSARPMRHQTYMTNVAFREGPPEKAPLILVVEDEPATQSFLVDALVKEGVACITATSVAEAIGALRKESIQLTVLDWGLDRSGCEVLNVAKELHPAMPVIAISGMPFEVRTDAVVNNADAFLSKPFSATVLSGQVKQLLERTRRKPAIELPQRSEDILPLAQVQSVYIRHVVQLLGGNKSRAAEALGIHRHTVSTALREIV